MVSDLPELVKIGVHTILTSGSGSSIEAGIDNLKQLLASGFPAIIMPGQECTQPK